MDTGVVADQGRMDELLRHNSNLVRTANDLRSQRNQACTVVEEVIEQADGIMASGEDAPTEYIIPVACLDAMRALVAVLKSWDRPNG